MRWALWASLLVAVPAWALPDHFVQEGVAEDAGGQPLDGLHTVRIRLWDAAAGGNMLFEELHPQVLFTNGWYAVAVGSEQPLQTPWFLNPVWLTVSIDRGPDLLPRLALAKVPGAFVADVARTALSVPSDLDINTLEINGNVVIDANGRWVGDATGLQGPQGVRGPVGPPGPAGGNGSPDTPAQVLAKLVTVDGPNSGLDADRLDGLDSTEFVRTPEQVRARLVTVDGDGSGVDADRLDGLDSSEFVRTPEQVRARLVTVDGAGSGVDADRLDGLDSTEFVRTPEQVRDRLVTVDGEGSGVDADRLDGLDSSEFVTTGAQILQRLAPVDGAGSGLDADRLDGFDSSQFLRADADGILAGDLDLRGVLQLGRAGAPPMPCTDAAAGALYFDTDEGHFYGCDGSTWVDLSAAGGGNGGGDVGLGTDENNPGENCQGILRAEPGARNGQYWIDPDGPGGNAAFKVYCDMNRGGWALLYATYINEAGPDTWRLSWDQTLNTGKRAADPSPGRNYLLPIAKWVGLGTVELTSQRSGTLRLDDFHIAPEANYQISFAPTANDRMNYHNGLPLSTFDRDNDVWGDNCAARSRSFGWYQSCCNLCMTTANAEWPGGPAYTPTDWNYTQTQWMVWWGRFKSVKPVNAPDTAGFDCAAMLEADDTLDDGIYWIDLDGDGNQAPQKVYCDMRGGGWTLLYAFYDSVTGANEWALDWNATLNVGKRTEEPGTGHNYLLPVRHWPGLSTMELRSAASGAITLESVDFDPTDNYRWNFRRTGNDRMDYHRGQALSTVDRDNDVWGDNCAGRARTFGWYQSCCNLCMTTANGEWPGGSQPYHPTDWNYTQSQNLSFWGKWARVNARNTRDVAGEDCRAIKQADPAAADGVYWVTLGTADRFRVTCDMTNGGWTKLYAFYDVVTGANEWALNWNTTVNLGKRHDAPVDGRNYLLPVKYWPHFSEMRLNSANAGTITLNNMSFDANDNYRWQFDATGNARMDYHRDRPLSTVDRDNDVWGDNCAGRGRTFGWYGSCCNLCMTTANGEWPGGTGAYKPCDWNYQQTEWMVWWAR